MATPARPLETIDDYISSFPPETRVLLEKMRMIIQSAAPGATEAISYQMPTFKLGGNLVHFAGYKHHVGFYPTPSAIVRFSKELASYETSKGAVRFPIVKPLPAVLIKRMVTFRVSEMKRQR